MRCEKCGNEVADNIPFGPFCGEKVTQEISVYEEKRGQAGNLKEAIKEYEQQVSVEEREPLWV